MSAAPAAAAFADRRKLEDPGDPGGALQDRQAPSAGRCQIETQARWEGREVAVATTGELAFHVEQIPRLALIARGQAAFPGRTFPVEPQYYIESEEENGSAVTSLPVAAK